MRKHWPLQRARFRRPRWGLRGARHQREAHHHPADHPSRRPGPDALREADLPRPRHPPTAAAPRPAREPRDARPYEQPGRRLLAPAPPPHSPRRWHRPAARDGHAPPTFPPCALRRIIPWCEIALRPPSDTRRARRALQRRWRGSDADIRRCRGGGAAWRPRRRPAAFRPSARHGTAQQRGGGGDAEEARSRARGWPCRTRGAPWQRGSEDAGRNAMAAWRGGGI